MLKMRKDKVYDEASLSQTEKFAKLSSDFSTIWNYRREIIEHLFGQAEGKYTALEAKLGLVKEELIMLVKLLMGNPKSYAIWEYRVWMINLGLGLERQYIAAMIAAKKKAAAEKAAAVQAAAEAAA